MTSPDSGAPCGRADPPGVEGARQWELHTLRAGSYSWESDAAPAETSKEHRRHIEAWLAALLQAEHLNLLVGNGLTTSVAKEAKAPPVDMKAGGFHCAHAGAVLKAAKKSAKRSGRGEPNLEDEIRAAWELIAGLRVLSEATEVDGSDSGFVTKAKGLNEAWTNALTERLKAFLSAVLETEQGIRDILAAGRADSDRIRRLLGSFLLTFASRTATRERLHIFTTNYDRLIEYGCDMLGLQVLDRFVGRLRPVFRASRLGLDMHYNPPGIRGEPRYLEGVVRLTKLHGSIDWRQENDASGVRILRSAVPFGGPAGHPDLPANTLKELIIYPNPAKDVETLEYPYAELFRDFAAAVCQPNAVLVTYGYGFGDDHINRILQDMLTVPSAHVAIMSFDDSPGRIRRFCDKVGRNEQITLLIGPHFGDLASLVEQYLPKPAIDPATWRMVDLVNRRTPRSSSEETASIDDVPPRGDL
jgi:hypothetical protein